MGNDDDRTAEADDTTMDELRRLAAEAKHPVVVDAGGTVDADGTTMDELRRLAAEAKQPVAVDVGGTVEADDATMDELRRLAADAKRSMSAPPVEARDSSGLPAPGQDVGPDRVSLGGDASPAPVPAPPVSPATVPPPPQPQAHSATADVTVAPTVLDQPAATPQPTGPLSVPPPSNSGERWSPPPRMVMPTEPDKRHEHHPGPWKKITVALAAVVVVLLVIVVVSAVRGGSDEDAPTDGSVPTSSTPAGDQGGSGG